METKAKVDIIEKEALFETTPGRFVSLDEYTDYVKRSKKDKIKDFLKTVIERKRSKAMEKAKKDRIEAYKAYLEKQALARKEIAKKESEEYHKRVAEEAKLPKRKPIIFPREK